jgi:hypothetical protein
VTAGNHGDYTRPLYEVRNPLDVLSEIRASTEKAAGKSEEEAAEQGRKPEERAAAKKKPLPEHGTFYVDPRGNVIPTPPGGRITGSPDGRYIQARDAADHRTGVRIDYPHKPAKHKDPRALAPHGHVPGVTNPDGTPWLPIKQ